MHGLPLNLRSQNDTLCRGQGFRVRVLGHLDAAAVVEAEHGRHKVAERVIAEVRADVGNAQALAGRQALRRGVRQPRHAQPRRRLQTAVRIPAQEIWVRLMPRIVRTL